MGGKDTIVVDNNIDTDFAAQAIVQSSFGFSGQKCSACSRAVIHEDVYNEVLEKAVALTKKLTVGDPVTKKFMGPVNDQNAYDKISAMLKLVKKKAG